MGRILQRNWLTEFLRRQRAVVPLFGWFSADTENSAVAAKFGGLGLSNIKHTDRHTDTQTIQGHRDLTESEMSIDWIHPWIWFDWIGSDDCYVQNYDGLCFSAKQTETIVYWLSTDIQTPKRKHKHTDSINNVGQEWKGSKRRANNHPNRYSTLETSTSQYVSKQL